MFTEDIAQTRAIIKLGY